MPAYAMHPPKNEPSRPAMIPTIDVPMPDVTVAERLRDDYHRILVPNFLPVGIVVGRIAYFQLHHDLTCERMADQLKQTLVDGDLFFMALKVMLLPGAPDDLAAILVHPRAARSHEIEGMRRWSP